MLEAARQGRVTLLYGARERQRSTGRTRRPLAPLQRPRKCVRT
ncbi:hypothetical protein [Corallococcus sp. AB045]